VRYLHRLKLLKASLLCDFILAFVGIVLKVTHVGDVANVANFVSLSLQIAEQKVEGNCRAGMAQVWVAIDGRSADIHSYTTRVDSLKLLLAAGEGVVEC
jgi:hypothetical protein